MPVTVTNCHDDSLFTVVVAKAVTILLKNVFLSNEQELRSHAGTNHFGDVLKRYLILKNDNYIILCSTYENFGRHDRNWNSSIPSFLRQIKEYVVAFGMSITPYSRNIL